MNWFQRGDDGRFLWPGYRENLRALLWLVQLKNGEVKGDETAVGVIPTKAELNLDGLDIDEDDLDTPAHHRRPALEAGDRAPPDAPRAVRGLPEAIWEAHRRVAEGAGERARPDRSHPHDLTKSPGPTRSGALRVVQAVAAEAGPGAWDSAWATPRAAARPARLAPIVLADGP